VLQYFSTVLCTPWLSGRSWAGNARFFYPARHRLVGGMFDNIAWPYCRGQGMCTGDSSRQVVLRTVTGAGSSGSRKRERERERERRYSVRLRAGSEPHSSQK
jgi:hypothetical protein